METTSSDLIWPLVFRVILLSSPLLQIKGLRLSLHQLPLKNKGRHCSKLASAMTILALKLVFVGAVSTATH